MAKRKSEPEKPTKKPRKSQPDHQLSICIPSTIISKSNAYNLQQITSIAYQVAKAATIYDVPEIIVLDIPSIEIRNEIIEAQSTKTVKIDKKIKFNEELDPTPEPVSVSSGTSSTGNENNSELFAILLQYFVTPPYLVKSVFKDSPYLPKLKYASHLPKLPNLPFMNNNQVHKDFKEGLTIPKKSPGKKNKNKLSMTKYVNIGEAEPLELVQEVPVNVRVTVDLKNKKVVSPIEAYGVIGYKSNFGYYTRVAKQFSQIFVNSGHPDGYTSSVYVNCDNYFGNEDTNLEFTKDNNRVLLVFGNPKDLKFSFDQESSLTGEFTDLFDKKTSIPNVRIEDAVMIGLTKASN